MILSKTAFRKGINRYQAIPLAPMDIVVLSYIALLGVLIIPFHHDVQRWILYPAGHVVLGFILLEFIRCAKSSNNRFLLFVRTFYPILLVALGWKEMNHLITMIFPYWANSWIVKMDLWLFGQHPTVWVQTLFRPWLTELMNFFYACFWFFIPVAGFSLYFSGEKKQTFDFLYFVVFTYAISYLFFILFPSEGAWVILKDRHTVQPVGGFFLRLNQFAQSKGTIRGGAFPSSHVAVAFAVTWTCLYQKRRMGWLFLFLSIGVALSTVYCRYHHAVDAIAGIVSGTILFLIGSRILERWNKRRTTTQSDSR